MNDRNKQGVSATWTAERFGRFYRVEKNRNGAAKGTGLVLHGALLHGAKIDLRSDGKSGTSVALLFPAKPLPPK